MAPEERTLSLQSEDEKVKILAVQKANAALRAPALLFPLELWRGAPFGFSQIPFRYLGFFGMNGKGFGESKGNSPFEPIDVDHAHLEAIAEPKTYPKKPVKPAAVPAAFSAPGRARAGR